MGGKLKQITFISDTIFNFIVVMFYQIINGKYVEGFYIYARDVDDDTAESGESTYKMLTVLNAGASSCNINGLEKYTTYEFFIVPFYKAVEGKPSNSRIASTLEDGKHLFVCLIIRNVSNIYWIYLLSSQ